jgi:hypothetical protein
MSKPPPKKPDLARDKKLLFVVGIAAVLIIGLFIFAA